MGISKAAIDRIESALGEQERDYAWLARRAGLPYKRVLAEVKHERRPLTLETALAVSEALGIELPDLVAEAVAS
jgi:DNA-binding phage protein